MGKSNSKISYEYTKPLKLFISFFTKYNLKKFIHFFWYKNSNAEQKNDQFCSKKKKVNLNIQFF